MNIFNNSIEEVIKNDLQEIEGLGVEVGDFGDQNTSVPTVWINSLENDLEVEDINPRRYMVTKKVGVVVISKNDLDEWAEKVFLKLEEKRFELLNGLCEDIKISQVKKVNESSKQYYFLGVEVMFNKIVEKSVVKNEAEVVLN